MMQGMEEVGRICHQADLRRAEEYMATHEMDAQDYHDSCIHGRACDRAYLETTGLGMAGNICQRLGCDDCDCYDVV